MKVVLSINLINSCLIAIFYIEYYVLGRRKVPFLFHSFFQFIPNGVFFSPDRIQWGYSAHIIKFQNQKIFF